MSSLPKKPKPNKSLDTGLINNAVNADSESMMKLRALREKISKEWEMEKKERSEIDAKETIVPLSLADDYQHQATQPKKSQQRRQMDRNAMHQREKINALKLDKPAQRELETELERKSVEMHGLKQQNHRLREIITLRQESNQRKETQLQSEIGKLKTLTDSVSIDVAGPDATMVKLRNANKDVQEAAGKLQSSIEEQAEADRLALIRRYRVRMREIRQQLNEQHQVNLEGAKAWIERHKILAADREEAEEGFKALEDKNTVLLSENKELLVMSKHQDDQRNTLLGKIAMVKRENERLEQQIGRLEGQLLERAHQVREPNPVRMVAQRRASSAASTSTPHPREQYRNVQTPLTPMDRNQSKALARVKRGLDEMRRSLKQVRSAHIELLQERTELEIFLRQCMEDVRRDMYKFTVVNTVSRGVKGDQLEETSILKEYGAKERKHLIDILNSKLQTLALLHENAFPFKPLPEAEILGDGSGRLDATAEGAIGADDELRQTIDEITADSSAELDMDSLWQRWKQWTTSAAQ